MLLVTRCSPLLKRHRNGVSPGSRCRARNFASCHHARRLADPLLGLLRDRRSPRTSLRDSFDAPHQIPQLLRSTSPTLSHNPGGILTATVIRSLLLTGRWNSSLSLHNDHTLGIKDSDSRRSRSTRKEQRRQSAARQRIKARDTRSSVSIPSLTTPCVCQINTPRLRAPSQRAPLGNLSWPHRTVFSRDRPVPTASGTTGPRTAKT